jgi:hypothetical protein
VGDQHLNTTTGEVFQWNGSAWVSTGNIKGADGNNGTSGTSGTSGTDGVSYTEVSINSIPASLSITNFINNGNSWRDAFVVVPTEYDGWYIHGYVVAYGDAWPSANNTFTVELRNQVAPTAQVVVASFNYSHPSATRAWGDYITPVQVTAGYTINIAFNSNGGIPAGGNASGYTATLLLLPTSNNPFTP